MTASKRSVLLRSPLLAGALMAGGCLAVAVLTNLGFLLTVEEAASATGESWRAVFPLDNPEFSENFWDGVRFYLTPLKALRALGGTYTWVFIIVLALLGWYWVVVLRNEERSAVFLLPAVMPVFVGMALLPLRIAETFDALAQQGLSAASMIGAGTGEATVTIYVGVVLSLVCLLAMLVTRARRLPSVESD